MRPSRRLVIVAACVASLLISEGAGASTKNAGSLITDRTQHFSFRAPQSFIRDAPQNSDEYVYLDDTKVYAQLFLIDPEGSISIAGLRSSVLLLEESTGGEYSVDFAPSVTKRFAAGLVHMVIFSVNSASSSQPVYGIDAGFRRGNRSFALTSYALNLAQAQSDEDLVLNSWGNS